MNRTALSLAAVAALAVVTCHPAGAAAKPKTAKPVTSTMWFHGTSQFGNQDQNPVNGTAMTMDTKKPTGTSDKQIGFLGYGGGPNTTCAGNTLFPNWVGSAAGTITGKMKISFYAQSTPNATAKVQVFGDVNGQLCNADYPTPLGEAVVPLAASPTVSLVTVTIPVVGKGKVFGSLDVQIQPGSAAAGLVGPQLSGVSYDSTASPSSITFTCIPKTGKKSC